MPNKKVVFAFGSHEEASDVDFLRKLASEQHFDAIGLEYPAIDNERLEDEQSIDKVIIANSRFPNFSREELAFLRQYELIPKILEVYSRDKVNNLLELINAQEMLLNYSLEVLSDLRNLDKAVKDALESIKLRAKVDIIRENSVVNALAYIMHELEEHPKLKDRPEVVMLAHLGVTHHQVYEKLYPQPIIQVEERFQYTPPVMFYYDRLVEVLKTGAIKKVAPMEVARAIYGILLYIASKHRSYNSEDSLDLSNRLVSNLNMAHMRELTRKLVPRNRQENYRIIWDYAHEKAQK